MNYQKMKKVMAMVGAAALLVSSNVSLTAMADEEVTTVPSAEEAEAEGTEEGMKEGTTETTMEPAEETETETTEITTEGAEETTTEDMEEGTTEETSEAETTEEDGSDLSEVDTPQIVTMFNSALTGNGLINSNILLMSAPTSLEDIQAANGLSWDKDTGKAKFNNPNSGFYSYIIKIYKDNNTSEPWKTLKWGSVAFPNDNSEDVFNEISETGKYQFQVVFIVGEEEISSDFSDVWDYTKQEPLPTPAVKVTKDDDGVIKCTVSLDSDKPVLQFGYQIGRGSSHTQVGWRFGVNGSVSGNTETINVIEEGKKRGGVTFDPKYDYYVSVNAKSSNLAQYSESKWSDWVKILDATEQPKKEEPKEEENIEILPQVEDNDNNNETSEQETTPSAPAYVPKTPEEIARFSVVGKEEVKYAVAGSTYPVKITNSLQGSKCFDSIKAVLGDYTIGRTFNIMPNGKPIYHTADKALITLTIPQALQSAGRTYKMICVTENGLPVELEDIDLNPTTITFETDTYYAFALVYKDTITN